MKVLCKCETCGFQWEPSSRELTSYLNGSTVGAVLCPVCHPPEPTYGPITVEMVAEMLYTARCECDEMYYGGPYPDCDDSIDADRAEARAVIRLLNELLPEEVITSRTVWSPVTVEGKRSFIPIAIAADEDWSAKLMDLAKGR